ncbi:MAG: hypothetical protein ACKODZ_06310, partial [Verrucomicrobiota bacterium]
DRWCRSGFEQFVQSITGHQPTQVLPTVAALFELRRPLAAALQPPATVPRSPPAKHSPTFPPVHF